MQSEHNNDGQKSNQQGFTILESLVAILVVGILLIAISPVIVLSIAVRLQAKRVDLATRAARLYIDGVKSEEIAPPAHTVLLDEVSDAPDFDFEPRRSDFVTTPAPDIGTFDCAAGDTTLSYYCENESAPPNSLYCVDGDDDGVNHCTADSNRDLIIQAFRSTTPSDDPNYLLGVRVYRADGFSDTELLEAGGEQLTATGGLGDRKVPLFQITTEVVRGDASLVDYCRRLGGCQ